ncbi:hypothetical protein IW262DRAFT_1465017 [Armillaria fumosa]|nr:hypothetical protein IW262DRAFT_1465017 [Armillaria fumosa]
MLVGVTLSNCYQSITLQAILVSADIQHATMVVEWSVQGDICSYSPTVNGSVIEIFFIANLAPSDPKHTDGPYNNNMPSDPIFTWNCSKGILDYISGLNPVTFRTELTLVVDSSDNSGRVSLYPFDHYSTTISAFAQNAPTNDSIAVDLTSTTALVLLIFESSGNLDGSVFEVTSISFKLQHSTIIIAYCLIITVTFWMVTLMICLIMIATVFFGFRQWNEIVVVPIGTVFAFTQLRASMPGAPEGFGDILDFAGILPCLVLLSISSITMIGMYLFDNPDNPSRKALTWSEIQDSISDYSCWSFNTVKEWIQRMKIGTMIALQLRRPPYNSEIPSMNVV